MNVSAGERTPGGHWPEYLMEGAGLGLFMISACLVTVLLQHPLSPVGHLIQHPFWRLAITGVAMGLTNIAIIYSPLGQRSGAHLNPSVTLTYWVLGKIAGWDALCFALAQIAGGTLGVLIAWLLIGPPLEHPNVNFAVTAPGAWGLGGAFVAEVAISFLLMTTVLVVSNSARWHRFTPWAASALVATYITFEAPISGMSMNPARSFGSSVFASDWMGWWIYWLAPPLGMVAAAAVHKIRKGSPVYCAKLYHLNNAPCIFRCRFQALIAPSK